MDLLIHPYKNYARISNIERLQASNNTEDRLKSLIERLDKCADFTTATGELVSETQPVRIAYRLVAETGDYPED